MLKSLAIILILVSFLASAVLAEIPQLINYQGRLTDSEGAAVGAGVYNIAFSIYDAKVGGDSLWGEQYIDLQGTGVVVDSNGLFTVMLGSIEAIPDSLFDGVERWLSFKIGADEPMGRMKLISTPYSYHAGRADLALSVDSNVVTSVNIVDGSIRFIDIGQNGAEPGQVLKWNSTEWVPDDDETGSGSMWSVIDSVLHTNKYWGIARGGADNHHLGDSAHTSVNWGAACTTGVANSTARYSTIGGGFNNKAEGHGTVGGGKDNVAGGLGGSTVGGGISNICNGAYSTIGGGYDNQTLGVEATIGGGGHNRADGVKVAICGGYQNTAIGELSYIGGGQSNRASGGCATVSGGRGNTADGDSSSVGGGAANEASGDYCVIGGGRWNHAAGMSSTVSGGQLNAAQGNYSTISGGWENGTTAGSAASGSVVGGGNKNHAKAIYAIIGGGYINEASAMFSIIGGGRINATSGDYSIVNGGRDNVASGYASIIGGGDSNTVSGFHANVGGGYNNHVAGDYSTILSGYSNTISADADTSYLFGIRSELTKAQTFMVDMPHIWFGDEATGYEVPSEDGTAGQVMATDGAGQVSWSDVGIPFYQRLAADNTHTETQSSTYVKVGEVSISPNSVSSYVNVVVRVKGSIPLQDSVTRKVWLDFRIGENGAELSKDETTISEYGNSSSFTGYVAEYKTFQTYYEPTSLEKSNGFDVEIFMKVDYASSAPTASLEKLEVFGL